MRRTFLSTGSPQTRLPQDGSQRWYVLQNWRQDVAVIIDEAAVQRERAFFSPYGRVFGMVAGDTGFDGDYGAGDSSAITGWSTAYRAYADVDLDGTIDTTDAGYTTNAQLGWDALSRDGSTIGYAGYVQDDFIPTINHVRHRAMKTDLGRWVQRDPAGYVDGANLYEYVRSSPVGLRDPMGLASGVGLGIGTRCGAMDSCGRLASPTKCPTQSENQECAKMCEEEGDLTFGVHSCSKQLCCVCDFHIWKEFKDNKEAMSEIMNCTDAHEICHRDQCVTGWPTSKACKEVECYSVSLQCLRKAQQRCSTWACHWEIQRAIDSAQEQFSRFKAQCLNPPRIIWA